MILAFLTVSFCITPNHKFSVSAHKTSSAENIGTDKIADTIIGRALAFMEVKTFIQSLWKVAIVISVQLELMNGLISKWNEDGNLQSY